MPNKQQSRLERLIWGKTPVRRLEVSVSGKWYLALTVGLGVVALVSGNNILYLIESLLLSGLIFSGVLSERTVSNVRCEFKRGQAVAGERLPDTIVVTNRSKRPLFCVEIGEWKDGRFRPVAFFPRIGGRASVSARSELVTDARGEQEWEGFAIATSSPFGFARKIKIIRSAGRRLVWPSRGDRGRMGDAGQGKKTGLRQGGEFADGEVRAMVPDDDWRSVVWTASSRNPDEPMVRVRRLERPEAAARLDLRLPPGEEFERRVEQAARPFHEAGLSASDGVLTLIGREGERRIRGRKPALDALARAQAQGTPAPESAA